MKKKVIIIFVVFSLLTIIGFLSYEKKIIYDKYAKITYENTTFNINKYNAGDTVFIKFKIKNISPNPFYITEINSDKDIDFCNTRIKKIIDTNQETTINIKFKLKRKKINKVIIIESNSDKGKIELKIIKNK